MNGYVGMFAIVFSQHILHLGSLVVSLVQADVPVHQDVQFYGVVVAQSPRAQFVWLCYSWHRSSQFQNLLFHLVG